VPIYVSKFYLTSCTAALKDKSRRSWWSRWWWCWSSLEQVDKCNGEDHGNKYDNDCHDGSSGELEVGGHTDRTDGDNFRTTIIKVVMMAFIEDFIVCDDSTHLGMFLKLDCTI
jgi:hypothetical protein